MPRCDVLRLLISNIMIVALSNYAIKIRSQICQIILSETKNKTKERCGLGGALSFQNYLEVCSKERCKLEGLYAKTPFAHFGRLSSK